MPHNTSEIPCKFHFGWDYKTGPCNRKKCMHSHKKQDWDNFIKANPQLKSTIVSKGGGSPSNPGGDRRKRASRSPRASRNSSRSSRRSSRSTGRGRSSQRSSSRNSRNTAASQASRQSAEGSVPPSKGCRIHLLHLVNGSKKCPYESCKFAHAQSLKEVTKEDQEWARKRKPKKPRRNSPAAGARPSPGPSPSRGKEKKNKKSKKGRS